MTFNAYMSVSDYFHLLNDQQREAFQGWLRTFGGTPNLTFGVRLVDEGTVECDEYLPDGNGRLVPDPADPRRVRSQTVTYTARTPPPVWHDEQVSA